MNELPQNTTSAMGDDIMASPMPLLHQPDRPAIAAESPVVAAEVPAPQVSAPAPRATPIGGAADAATSAASGIGVLLVKPGFVDTPMTAAFRKNILWASAQSVGKDVARAIIRGTPVVYTPGFWRLIMWIIRSIPEAVFRRLSL